MQDIQLTAEHATDKAGAPIIDINGLPRLGAALYPYQVRWLARQLNEIANDADQGAAALSAYVDVAGNRFETPIAGWGEHASLEASSMAIDLIRHIAGLYSGKAIKGDFTQIYITGNEIWMAQQILASQQGQQRAALAQHSPAPELEPLIPDNIPRFVLAEGRMSQSGSGTWMRDSWLHLIQDQHDRIVGALIAAHRKHAAELITSRGLLREELEAAQARVAELERSETALSECCARLQDKVTQAGQVPDDVEAFLDEVRAELLRARSKFPGDRIMTIALAEEFGELCKAVLDEPAANVRKEAVQTAVMAARVVLDGDGSVAEWRAERGLDQLAAAPAQGGE